MMRIVIRLSSASLTATSKPMNLNKMQTELEDNLIMTVFSLAFHSFEFRVEQSVGAIQGIAEFDSLGKLESSTRDRSARSSAYWGSGVATASPRAIEKHLSAEETHVEGGECTQRCYVRIGTTQLLHGAISPIKCAGSATCISANPTGENWYVNCERRFGENKMRKEIMTSPVWWSVRVHAPPDAQRRCRADRLAEIQIGEEINDSDFCCASDHSAAECYK